jgi:putative transposase
MPRLVVPNYPHHVTQRGARRQTTFFSDADYRTYMKLLAAAKDAAAVDIWAYCLMPNHVHHVLVPRRKNSLARFLSDAHRRYARHVNSREGWLGHLWQERFHSVVMDERYLIAAVRYVELNPVRAGLCRQPRDWPWSSARAHLAGRDDALVTVQPMLERIDNWQAYLAQPVDPEMRESIRRHTQTGRPDGTDRFLRELESITGRKIRKRTRIAERPGCPDQQAGPHYGRDE